VVGARSALFLPFRALGLIVVDEEHDAGYKQEDGVHYHARDMAVLRGAEAGAAVILASATPALESWANARAGKYARLDLPERAGAAALPTMSAIDMRTDGLPSGALDRAHTDRCGDAEHLKPGRTGHVVPQPPRIRAADPVPRLRCTRSAARTATRGWSTHRFLRAIDVPPMRADESKSRRVCPACGARKTGWRSLGPGVERLHEEASGLARGANRGSVVGHVRSPRSAEDRSIAEHRQGAPIS
jgi:primosomal protein N' (replication factor Y)